MADDFGTALNPGDSFKSRLFLRTCLEQKKGKGPDMTMTLNDGCQKYHAKKWKVSEEESQKLSASQFLRVSGSVDQGDYAGEVTVTSFEAAQAPADVSPYLRAKHDDHGSHLARFEALMDTVGEPYLRQLLERVFDKQQVYWPQYCGAYAAGKMHHAYPGGLLHHSVEVAELCFAFCDVIPTLSRDLLVACALLHDIGKLDEMDHGLGAGEYTDAGVLSGHIMSGVLKLRPFMSKRVIPDFPDNLRETVTHMILSHHGTREYGSPQTPSFPEAQVLAQCDLMSARVFQYGEAIRDKKEWLPGKDSIRLYLGDLGLSQKSEEVVESQPAKTFTTRPLRKTQTAQTFGLARLPVMSVAAGFPGQSSEEVQDTREVVLPAGGADYLLRVVGESMVGAGILPSDLLFVKVQEDAKNGEIVIANVASHGDVVKRLRRDLVVGAGAGRVWLDSENPAPEYQPIPVDEDTRIHGKVIGLLREF